MTDQLAAHLWQSTWFAIAAALLTLAFRKNRAQVRYWMWTTASLKFLLPFALLMNLGDSLSRTPAAQQIASHEVAVVVERIAQPFSELVPPPAAASPNRRAVASRRHTRRLGGGIRRHCGDAAARVAAAARSYPPR